MFHLFLQMTNNCIKGVFNDLPDIFKLQGRCVTQYLLYLPVGHDKQYTVH